MDTWDMVARERTDLADLMATFTDEQWGTTSLCEGWSARLVAAHLVGWFQRSLPTMLAKVVALRSFEKAIDFFVQHDAKMPTARIVDELRKNATNHFKPPFAPPELPLTEVVVHSLDIRVPLGLTTELPAEDLDRVLDYLVSKPATRGMISKDRVPGLRLGTTDSGWSFGAGQAVSGPAASLVLALMGRPAGLQHLQGDGVAELRRRIGT
jgi:uncharacterized protein (TIGR03083 family)